MLLVALIVLFAYPFVLYAPILAVMARLFRHPPSAPSRDIEKVALVICALNEQSIIGQKIENSLALDYPRDELEIIVISDGSTDNTVAVAERYKSSNVRVINQPVRRGKVRNLIDIVPTLSQDIVVFSDANVMYDFRAMRELVKRFHDSSVGCVSGKVALTDTTDPLSKGTGDYYTVEWGLQEHASSLYSMMGADGAMYAIRRELFQPPAPDTVIEDFVVPMSVLRQGYRVVFEPRALGWEQGSASLKEEFARKTRIGAGAIQSLLRGNGWPRRTAPKAWFIFVSHKLLRWLSPILGAATLVIAALTLNYTLSRVVIAGSLILSLAAGLRVVSKRSHRGLDGAFYFVFGQVAAAVGIIKGLSGKQSVLWVKANR